MTYFDAVPQILPCYVRDISLHNNEGVETTREQIFLSLIYSKVLKVEERSKVNLFLSLCSHRAEISQQICEGSRL